MLESARRRREVVSTVGLRASARRTMMQIRRRLPAGAAIYAAILMGALALGLVISFIAPLSAPFVQSWSRQDADQRAQLVFRSVRQRVDAESPLLSAALPGGERIQIVLPPATTPGTVAITIRRPADEVWTLEELEQRGLFRTTRRAATGPDETEAELLRLLEARDYQAFLRLAVECRRNILVSGPTGSGKTTFTKALIREIPADERLITIEDAKELVLDRHDNHVRLFYSKDDQGLARVSPKQLLESCLRMKPDRILLAELRGEEAFDYLRNVNSGHPGSITSIHAASAELAFEQLVLLVKQSRAGQELAREEIKHLLYLLIDVVVQFGVEHRQRCIQEIWYDPDRKHRTLAAAR